MRGALSLYTSDAASSVTIAGIEVPLEYEPTAALAFTLEGAPIWDFELAGFFSGAFGLGARDLRRTIAPGPQSERPQDGIFLMAPYRPGKIPVVLVHGTASSPARWAELVNELQIDPRIAARYQLWLFRYNTGNPIAYSGALLRQGLLRTVQQLDPEGKDPALRQMVVIGHSQGGLLTKRMVVNSGTKFWDNVSRVPVEELDLKAETRDLLRGSLFLAPVCPPRDLRRHAPPGDPSGRERHRRVADPLHRAPGEPRGGGNGHPRPQQGPAPHAVPRPVAPERR